MRGVDYQPLSFFLIMKGLLLFVVLTLALSSRASSDFNTHCQKAYSEIICLRFDAARKILASEKKTNPSNTIPFLLENYISFLSVMISEEEKDLKILLDNKDLNLQHLSKGDRNSPWFLYSQAEVFLQAGMAKVKFQEYLSAGLDINRAYRLLTENEKKFPAFMPAKIRIGLLHSLVGTVPDQYKWAARALDFQGSIPQGIGELKQAYLQCLSNPANSTFIPEALFLLSFVSINLSGDRTSANELVKEFQKPAIDLWVKNSPLITYCLANVYQKSSRNDEAIKTLESFQPAPGQYHFYYLDYLLGVARLNRLDPDAHLPLLKYLASFKGMNYIRAAYQNLAWYYLIQGNREKYNVYMDRIFLRGSKQVDNDVQALQNAEKKQVPDINLLKARLLFDGGYHEKCSSMLDKFAESNAMNMPELRLEYTYRKARLLDEWGKIPEAVTWYKKTISRGKSYPSYFAANSALHLGMISEQAGKTTEAEEYYKLCLDLEFTEYHFSITQKAKSGLNRIKNR